jgi:predicted acylesterase/phospholipase RssA
VLLILEGCAAVLQNPQVTPLDWDAVIDSPLPLKVVASSLTTLQAEAFSDFTDKQDLVECLMASANVPRIVGPPREHRGHQLVDAAVFEPIPVKAALRDGCTHVLALCSRAPDEGPAWGKLVKKVVHNAVKYTVLNPVSTCKGLVCATASSVEQSNWDKDYAHQALTCKWTVLHCQEGRERPCNPPMCP